MSDNPGGADQADRADRADHAESVYTYVSAFIHTMASSGVRLAIVSPGSRSTPLAITAHRATDLDTAVVLDERSAGFLALGAARSSGCPTALICTSGTAVANYLPAVTEASYSGVPLVILSADRPTELRDWGAGQTIDQPGIFSSHVRARFEVPIPNAVVSGVSALDGGVGPEHGRRLAARAVALATGQAPGPVHLNWPFRMPLEPPEAPAPSDEIDTAPQTDGADGADEFQGTGQTGPTP